MNIVDDEGVPFRLSPRFFYSYIPWLLKEVIVSNIDVARRIMDPALPIRPVVAQVRARQQKELWRVIYANSITLTPGTVSIDLDGDQVMVHALCREEAEEDIAGGMNRRVAELEGRA